MIIMFGWLKEAKLYKAVLESHCYVCQRKSSWDVLRVTEWVTFFTVRTIPFLVKDTLTCGGCKCQFPIQRGLSNPLIQGQSKAHALEWIEQTQLAGKSEVQRNFLRSMRAQREDERSWAETSSQ